MRAPLLFTIIFAIHAIAIGGFISLQGCATRQSTAVVEPPPNPVMPPVRTPPAASPGKAPKRFVPTPPTVIRKAAPETLSGEPYIIQKGDMLSKVAYRYGISTRELIEFNDITNPDKIKVGQKIFLPPHAKKRSGVAAPRRVSTSPSSSATVKSVPAAPAVASGDAYVVRPGDSLSAIAKRYGTSVSALRSVNGLTSDRILVGQKLKLPTSAKKSGSGTTAAARPSTDIFAATRSEKSPTNTFTSIKPVNPGAEKTTALDSSVEDTLSALDAPDPVIDQTFEYTVQEGETLEAIAKAFIVSEEDIMKLNKITDPSSVRPGVKLKIPPSEF